MEIFLKRLSIFACLSFILVTSIFAMDSEHPSEQQTSQKRSSSSLDIAEETATKKRRIAPQKLTFKPLICLKPLKLSIIMDS